MGEEQQTTLTRHVLAGYGYMALWVSLSAGVIMFNKFILDPDMGGFPFPITLTALHMAFCSAVSWVLVRCGAIEVAHVPTDVYLRMILQLGALFAITLWMGNAAYIHLSVSFIQMLKAVTPLLVYVIGMTLGTEKLCRKTVLTLVVVVVGVLTASLGEVVFVLLGFVYQCTSMVSEATRLTLVQILLQGRGIKLNPITTMYYVSPVCLMCLLIPFATLEAEKLAYHDWKLGWGVLLMSAAAAFALNCAIYLLIGKTSALTMNIAGVVKDVMLITLSMVLYGSVVTQLQYVGYALALCGVFYYNYHKVATAQAAGAAAKAAEGGSDSVTYKKLSGAGSAGEMQDSSRTGGKRAKIVLKSAVGKTSEVEASAVGQQGGLLKAVWNNSHQA